MGAGIEKKTVFSISVIKKKRNKTKNPVWVDWRWKTKHFMGMA